MPVRDRVLDASATLLVLAIVAIVYVPVSSCGFVWDDLFYFYDRAWLREGNQWWQIVLHGFPDWKIYFRPLGNASYTAQLRLFQSQPSPMHWVSLGLHAINILLVGALCGKLLEHAGYQKEKLFIFLAMLFYGLHPGLIEPVTWISSQYDLLATLFVLAGLLANLALRSAWVRATTVAVCFFLAALSKEAAVAFPLLLVVLDWMSADAQEARTLPNLIRRQQGVYVAVGLAAFCYLIFRRWGIGIIFSADSRADVSLNPLDGIYEICVTYLAYLRLLIWPMTGLNPVHSGFELNTAMKYFVDFIAVAIAAMGARMAYKKYPLGGLLFGFTVALLPVLHIIPVNFDDSFYHERYSMTAIAVASAFLPMVLVDFKTRHRVTQVTRFGLAAAFFIWMLLCIVNIRVTLPLWADEVRLWKWAIQQNPDSISAKDALLSTYIERNDVLDSRPIADALLQSSQPCARCMLNIAFLALMQRDGDRADIALKRAAQAINWDRPPPALVIGFLLGSGNLSELRNNPAQAEDAYRSAISLDPLSPEAYMNLAILKVRQGSLIEAREIELTALRLSAPSARKTRDQKFENEVDAFNSRELNQ